jgi:hypothetical protein
MKTTPFSFAQSEKLVLGILTGIEVFYMILTLKTSSYEHNY